jgi:hypothetical protein
MLSNEQRLKRRFTENKPAANVVQIVKTEKPTS